MNRKRDDQHFKDELSPLTKKLKNPLAIVDEFHLNNHQTESHLFDTKRSIDENKLKTDKQDNYVKLSTISNLPVQSSANMSHNRKRRARMSADSDEQGSSVPYAPTSTTSQQRKRSDLSCVVCNGLAHGYNFDAISCESCKAFFRRNALFDVDRLKCRRDGTCEITLETRRRCKSCRLKKCFAVGMRKEWILTEEEKVNKKLRIEENRRLRMTTLREGNDLTMTKSDMDLQNLVLTKTHDCQQLSENTTDLLNNVVRAFNDGFKLETISYGWSYPLAKKITALCQILNTKNTTALRLISFYKLLPEFDGLNELDKVNLIKSNLPYIFIFHASLGYDPKNDVYHESCSTNDSFVYYGSDILEAHGSDIYTRCTLILRSLQSIVEEDRRIIQLALIIFLFSKGLATLNDTNELLVNIQQVYHVQNMYVEQLWLFMEKYFGSIKATKIFSKLITQCLHTQKLLRDIQQDLNEKIDPLQVPPIIRSLMNLS